MVPLPSYPSLYHSSYPSHLQSLILSDTVRYRPPPSPALSVPSCAVEGLYPLALSHACIATAPRCLERSRTLCPLLCCRSITQRVLRFRATSESDTSIALLSVVSSVCHSSSRDGRQQALSCCARPRILCEARTAAAASAATGPDCSRTSRSRSRSIAALRHTGRLR